MIVARATKGGGQVQEECEQHGSVCQTSPSPRAREVPISLGELTVTRARSAARAGGSLQDAQLRLLLREEMSWQKQSKASPDRAALTPCHAAGQISIC